MKSSIDLSGKQPSFLKKIEKDSDEVDQTKDLKFNSNPILKMLFFDLGKAQIETGQSDFILMEGDAFRALLMGIKQAFGPVADDVLRETGKYVGNDFVTRLMAEGIKPEKALNCLRATFLYSGWGTVHFQIITEKKEAFVEVKNCVTARNAKLGQSLCHFMEGYFLGIFEALWKDIFECVEVHCSAKRDARCTFKVLRLLKEPSIKW